MPRAALTLGPVATKLGAMRWLMLAPLLVAACGSPPTRAECFAINRDIVRPCVESGTPERECEKPWTACLVEAIPADPQDPVEDCMMLAFASAVNDRCENATAAEYDACSELCTDAHFDDPNDLNCRR